MRAARHISGGKEGIRRSSAGRIIWTVHRGIALSAGALILLSSITGSLLVMHHELERIVEPGRHVIGRASATPASSLDSGRNTGEPEAGVPPRVPPAPIGSIVRAVAKEAPPGFRLLRMMTARSPDESAKILFVAPDGRTRWAAFVNPHSGNVLWSGADQRLFTPWILHLHMHLRAGGWGYIITGLGGVGLFLLGLSGMYLHRAGLRTFWRPVRIGRGWRIAVSDLHRWVGTVSIYFSLVLGLTGAIYAAKIAPAQIAAPNPQPAAFDLARLTPVEPAIQQARERFPGAEILRVAFPTHAKAALTVLVLHRDAPVWCKFSRMDFDPVTGAVRAVRAASEATPREKFSAMLAPLHFGFYGSPLVKWLYVAGGFAPAVLALSGTAIWLLRKRRRPEAAADTLLNRPIATAAANSS